MIPEAMRAAAEAAKQAVGDGSWSLGAGGGSVYTSRAVVRVNKGDGNLSRSGYNGYPVLITMGTAATRRDRFTAAHMVASCPEAVLQLLDTYEHAMVIVRRLASLPYCPECGQREHTMHCQIGKAVRT